MTTQRKFRIFDHPWHLGHQFEMLKFPFAEWSWLENYKRKYSSNVRGDMEQSFKWVAAYERGKYDVAILHLDQQCFEPGIWNSGKGLMYQDLNKVIDDIPKIVLMHGTPYYPEMYATSDVLKEQLKLFLGDNFMVCNSHRAKEQWGIERSKTIIHGLDPAEWWDLPKESRVVTMISPAGLPMYYDRDLLKAVKDLLEEKSIYHCHITVDWNAQDWADYRNFLGRSLVYFNPTRESPMPRSRTEAMLSGCCVITTPHQDADSFIRNGENGFLCKRSPKSIVDRILWCLDHYDEAIKIGQEGKKTAIELFNLNRYQDDWYNLICDVIDKKI